MAGPLAHDDPRAPTTAAARARLNGARGLEDHGLKAGPLPFASPGKLQPPARPVPPDAVPLGSDSRGGAFWIRLGSLMTGRLLVQGNSGAGKSWLLRKLLEESAARVQQIVIDPEGEFASLAELLDYPVIAAHQLDADGALVLAERVRQARISIVIDLSQIDRERQMQLAAHFLAGLIDCPRELWHPALVAIDEAHLIAPFGVQGYEAAGIRKAAVAAVADLMARGRKRGLCGVIATQRLARLSKSVASEVSNFLIGGNTLDLDIRRAAETIGWDARRAFDRLPLLPPGDFVAVGPAFPDAPVTATIGMVKSRHLGAAPPPEAAARHSAAAAAALLGLDDLAAAEPRDDRRLPQGYRAVRGFIRDPAFALAGRLFGELVSLYPDGSRLIALAAHLVASFEEVAAAVGLLESWHAVETSGTPGPDLAVRIARDLAPPPNGQTAAER